MPPKRTASIPPSTTATVSHSPAPPASVSRKPRHGIDATGEVCMVSTKTGRALPLPRVPLKTFELAMECGGSYILHFSIDKNSEAGQEGRKLLMLILEPLLGEGILFSEFLTGVNSYCQSRRYKEGFSELKEDIRRFIDEATKGWKKKNSM